MQIFSRESIAMFRGNRVLLAALGLAAAITCGIGWWTLPSSPTTQQFRYDTPRNDDYRPGGSECQPSSLSRISDTQIRLNKAQDCEKQAEEYRQSSDDLIQQTRAANAAQAQADIASQQLWTGWLQTLGGLLTLFAAVGAAIYAREAAKHTRDANKITVDSQRPWITLAVNPVVSRQDPEGETHFRINVTAQNVGQKPATHFGCCSQLLFFRGGENYAEMKPKIMEQLEAWYSKQRPPFRSILAPNGSEVSAYWASFKKSQMQIEQIAGIDVAHPVLVVAVFYRSVTDPDILQIAWRVSRIVSKNNDWEEITSLYLDRDCTADRMATMPVTGARHMQRDARKYDDTQDA